MKTQTPDAAWSTRLLINKYEHPPRPLRLAPPALRLTVSGLGRVAPERAARFAEKLYFSPRRYPAPARERAWLEDAEHARIETEAGALALHRWTPTPFPWERTRGTVILAHGWEGRGSQMGAFARPLVERGFSVVALDAPAHGRSPGTSTDLFTYARCLRALAEEAGNVRAVVAHSAGSAATFLMLELGVKLEALALVAPPSDFSWIASSFARAIGLPEEPERRFRRRLQERLGEDLWDRFSIDALAPLLSMPGFVVHDEEDDELPIAHAETLVARWPAATLERTQGLGHRRIMRDPVVVQRIAAFLDETLA